MDLKPLRYHPLRYDLLRDGSDDAFQAFWDGGLTENEIAEIGGPEALEAAEEREETLARIIDRFDAAGRHIYHLEPKLTEMFRRTSVDDIPIDLITVPFQTIFIYFGPAGGVRHPADGRVMDGAYVSLSRADDGSILFITLCPELPNLASVRQLSQIARLREDQGYRHLAFHSSAETIGQELTSMTARYDEMVSEFEHYRRDKVLRDAGNSSSRVSYDDARRTRRPLEDDLLWKEKDVEAVNLIVNALAFLTSRPEDVEYEWRDDLPEKLSRKARDVNDPKQAERAISKLETMGYRRVYTCGKRLAQRVGDGTHGSPEAHWRRGHWRLQAHGTGRSDRKLIWIEPTLVNPAATEPLGRIHMVSEESARSPFRPG